MPNASKKTVKVSILGSFHQQLEEETVSGTVPGCIPQGKFEKQKKRVLIKEVSYACFCCLSLLALTIFHENRDTPIKPQTRLIFLYARDFTDWNKQELSFQWEVLIWSLFEKNKFFRNLQWTEADGAERFLLNGNMIMSQSILYTQKLS